MPPVTHAARRATLLALDRGRQSGVCFAQRPDGRGGVELASPCGRWLVNVGRDGWAFELDARNKGTGVHRQYTPDGDLDDERPAMSP